MPKFKPAGSLRADRRVGSRRWLVVFIALALLVLLSKLYAWSTGRPSPLDVAFSAVTTPVVYVIKRIGDGVSYTFRVIGSFPTLLRERRELQSANELLERRNAELQHLAAENTQLRRLLKLKMPPGYTSVAANVVSRPYDLWLESLIINAGTRDSIKLGNLVVNEQGVVGKISEVSANWSRVQLVISPQFRLGAVSSRQKDGSRSEGVIRGVDRNTLAFEYVSAGSTVAVDDKVYTMGAESYTGGDNNRPRGMLIGTVTERVADKNGFLQITVAPAANASNIGTVVVLTR